MNAYVSIARPYAKAAFVYAKEHNLIEKWHTFLQCLAIVVQNTQVTNLLENPQIDEKDKLAFIVSFVVDEISLEQKNFLAILSKFHRLNILASLEQLFRDYIRRDQNRLDAQIISAFPLEEEQLANLNQSLQKRFGQSVQMSVSIDSTLIGGVIIQVENFVIDGSISGKLQRLRKILTR